MFTIKSTLAVVCLALCAGDAVALAPCAPRDDLVKLLSNKYNEGPVSYGTANGTALVEVFASEKGTFTIIATQSTGLSCIIAAGQDWEAVGPPPKNLTSL